MTLRLKKSLFLIISVMFVVLIALTYRQALSGTIVSHPDNRRSFIEEFSIDRGKIYAADGSILSESKLDDKTYRREYPQGAPFATITGYYNARRGSFGLEASQNEWLSPKEHFESFNDWLDSLLNKKRQGFDITLSVRPDIQLKAWRLLSGKRGSIVVLDPRDGAILAFVSRPSYDPNLIDKDWQRISSTKGLLVNRASQGLYPPGSTFKIITTASALSSGVAKPTSVYDGPGTLRVYGGKVMNFAGQDQGRMSLASAFSKSTNTIFAQVGLDVGAERLVSSSERFGLNHKIPFDLPVARSLIEPADSMDKLMLAWTAVGQGRTLVTPLQMTLATAAIAQDGRIYRPFIVKSISDRQGKLHQNTNPRLWLQAIDIKTATQVKKMMVETVQSGTGKAAALPSISVAGKTGTAELDKSSPPHAWFVGFAPAENPSLVVAVIVENGGLGGQTAAPIAREILLTAANSLSREF